MDGHNKNVIKQFLEMHWDMFQGHCQEFEVDAEEALNDFDENA